MNRKLVAFWIVWGCAVFLGLSTVDNTLQYLMIAGALFLAATAGAINASDLLDRYESR